MNSTISELSSELSVVPESEIDSDNGSDNASFTNPLTWERVPCVGTDLGLETYRALIDGVGWVVVQILTSEQPGASAAISSTFVPDSNAMWGK